METVAFDTILTNSLRAYAATIGGFVVLVFIILAIDVLYHFITKNSNSFSIWSFTSNSKKKTTKLSNKEQIILGILLIVVMVALLLGRTFNIYSDISKKQYICVTTNYEFTPSTEKEGGLFSNGYVYISVDGKRMALELPEGWTLDEFPQGTYYGDVWYSKDSEYILAFYNKSIP